MNEDIRMGNWMDVWNDLLEWSIWTIWMSEWIFSWNVEMVNRTMKRVHKTNYVYSVGMRMVEYKGSVIF